MMHCGVLRLVVPILVLVGGGALRPATLVAGSTQRLLDQPRDGSQRDRNAGPTETEVIDRTVAMPANGTLRLKNFSGEIRITPASGRDVVLKATRRAARDVLDHVKLDVSTTGSVVIIEANRRDPNWERRPNTSDVVDTRMELQVPASTDLDIDVFSSDISIEGMNADQRLKTFSGGITVRDLKGEIDAETFSGDIRVRLDAATKGNVSFDSFSGRLNSDVAISVQSSGRRGNRVEATLPSGTGPRLRFHTFSGNVDLTAR